MILRPAYSLRRGLRNPVDHKSVVLRSWTKATRTVAVAVLRSIAYGITTAATGVLCEVGL